MRPEGVAITLVEGAVQAVDGNEGQAVGVDEGGHFGDVMLCREELFAFRRVDAVIAGMRGGRRGDAHVHFAGAGGADHFDDLAAGGAADNRIVDQDDALAFQDGAVGGMLHLHAEISNVVGRFDEGAADIVVADDAEVERQAAFERVAHGGGDAGVGDGDDDVGVDRAFAGEFGADFLAGAVDRRAFHDGVGAGEIDVFEDAETGASGAEGFDALNAAVGDDDDFAGLHVAHKGGADDVERAGFAGQHPGGFAVCDGQVAENEGADAERVARADQGLVAEGDEGVGAGDLAQGADQAFDHRGAAADGDEVDEHLAVGGGLEDAAAADEVALEGGGVGEVAVVGDREAAEDEFGE